MALQQVPDLLSDGSVLSFFNKLDGCASGFFATDSTPTTTVSGYEDQAMRPNGVAFQAGADAVDAQPKINVGALAAVADVVDCVGYCPDRQGRETPKSENGAGVSGAPEGRSADHGASSMDLGRYGSVASSASWEDAAAAEWVKMLEAPVYQPLADFSSESRGQMPSTSTSTGTGTGDSAKEMRKTAEELKKDEKRRTRKKNWARMKREREQMEKIRLEKERKRWEERNETLRKEIQQLTTQLAVYKSVMAMVHGQGVCCCQR